MSENSTAERVTVQVSIESFDIITAIASLRALTTDEAVDFLIRLGQSRFGALAHYAMSRGLGMPGTGRRRTVRAVDVSGVASGVAPMPVKKKKRKKKARRRSKKVEVALFPSEVSPDGFVSTGESNPVKPKRGRPPKPKPVVPVAQHLLTDDELLAQPASSLNGTALGHE